MQPQTTWELHLEDVPVKDRNDEEVSTRSFRGLSLRGSPIITAGAKGLDVGFW